jgi:Flp pilus assembly protein TadD
MSEPLQNIIFIAVPDSLDRQIGSFQVDPDRLLPVETTTGSDRYDIHDLAWEQIVSGMLKILAYAPNHEDADYYREFVLAVTPEIVEELTETAVIKTRNGDFGLAEEIFLALLGLQKGDQRARVNLALFYEQRASALKQTDEESAEEYTELARETYETIFASDDILPEAHLNAGFFHARLQEYDRARMHLAAYLSEDIDDDRRAEVQEYLDQIEAQHLGDQGFHEAYEQIRKGNEEKGISLIREFLEQHPDVWNAWFLLGWAHRRLSQYAEAKEAFEKALETGPRQADTLNELAICHMELDDLMGAQALLVEALRAEPENTKIISNLGIVALRGGRNDEARAYFQTVLELNPEDEIAKAYLQDGSSPA